MNLDSLEVGPIDWQKIFDDYREIVVITENGDRYSLADTYLVARDQMYFAANSISQVHSDFSYSVESCAPGQQLMIRIVKRGDIVEEIFSQSQVQSLEFHRITPLYKGTKYMEVRFCSEVPLSQLINQSFASNIEQLASLHKVALIACEDNRLTKEIAIGFNGYGHSIGSFRDALRNLSRGGYPCNQ